MMRDAARRSSLCHPGFHRQDLASAVPAVRTQDRATPATSPIDDALATHKAADEFDGRNPFIPSSKLSHSAFETVLIAAALAAALAVSLLALCSVSIFQGQLA